MRTRRFAVITLVAAVLTTVSLPAIAAPGGMDSSFTGTQTANLAVVDGRINIQMASTGIVSLAGVIPATRMPFTARTDKVDPALWAIGTNSGDIGIAAISENGSLSNRAMTYTSGKPFNAGRLNIDLGGSTDSAYDVQLDSADRVVIAATASTITGFTYPVILRMDANGAAVSTSNMTLDTANTRSSTIADVVVDSTDNVYVAGNAASGTAWIAKVAATNGALDRTYAVDGIKAFGLSRIKTMVAAGNDGLYVVFGGDTNDTLRRFASNGDNTAWASNGDVALTLPTGFKSDEIQTDGVGIYLSGHDANGDIVLLAYDTNGDPIAGFGTNGAVTFSYSNSGRALIELIAVADYTNNDIDRVILVGSTAGNGVRVTAISRDTGATVTSWGNAGTALVAKPTNAIDVLVSLEIDRNNKPVIGLLSQVAGSAAPMYSIVRLQSYDASPAPVIDETGTFPKPSAVTIAFAPAGAQAGTNPAPVIGYTAECTPATGGTSRSAYDTAADTAVFETSPITVTGLTNGVSYVCTVSAVNTAGASTKSAPSRAMTPVNVADAPALTTVTGNADSLDLFFTRPAATGGQAIIGYQGVCSVTVAGKTTTTSADTTDVNATALMVRVPAVLNPGGTPLSHNCTVLAYNAVGYSGASNAVTGTIDPLPSVPKFSSISAGNRSITVSVTPTSKSPATPVPTVYTVKCTGSSSSQTITIAANGYNAVSGTIDNLTNNVSYTCTVSATSSAGTSALSAPSTAVKPIGAPPMPIISSMTAGDTAEKLVVKFRPGSATAENTAANKFVVTCTPSTGTATTVEVIGTGASEYTATITPVVPTLSYTCAVRGVVVEGAISLTSAASAPVSVRTGVVPEGAPKDVTLSVGANVNEISIKFTPLTGNGITYRAECSAPGAAALNRENGASPIVVSGVNPTKTYACIVFAKGSGGDGPKAPEVTIRTGQLPAAVALTAGASTKDKTVAVKITPPTTTGSAVLPARYTVACTDGIDTFTASGTELTYDLTVTYGALYTCTGQAVNDLGASAVSATTAAVNITGPLRAPGKAVTTGTNGKINITVAKVPGAIDYLFECTGPTKLSVTSKDGNASAVTAPGLYTCVATVKNTTVSTAGEKFLVTVEPVVLTAKAEKGSIVLALDMTVPATGVEFRCDGQKNAQLISKEPTGSLYVGGGSFICSATWLLSKDVKTTSATAEIKVVPVAPKLKKANTSVTVRIPKALPEGTAWRASCFNAAGTRVNANGKGTSAVVKGKGFVACVARVNGMDSARVNL